MQVLFLAVDDSCIFFLENWPSGLRLTILLAKDKSVQIILKYQTFIKISINLLSKLFNVVLVFATLKLLSLQFDTQTYGIWTQLLFSSKLLIPIVVFQLETTLIRFFQDKKYNTQSNWLALLCFIVFLNLTISSLLVLFQDFFAQIIFGSSKYANFIIFISAFTLTESLFIFLTSYFRAEQRTEIMSVLRSLYSLLQLIILLYIVWYLQDDLSSLICGYIGIGFLLNLCIFFWLIRKHAITNSFKIVIKWSNLNVYLRFAYPLVLSGLSTWLIYVSDRFFLAHFYDLDSVGQYAAISIFGSLVLMLLDAFSLLILPQCVQLWMQNFKPLALKYAKVMSELYLIIIGLGLLLVLTFGSELLVLLSNDSFFYPAYWIALLMFSYALQGYDQPFIVVMHLKQSTHQLIRLSIFITCLNVCLNLLFIPNWGIKGAILATFFTHLTKSIWLRRLISTHEISKKVDWINLVKYTIIVISIYITSLLIFNPTTSISLIFGGSLVISIIYSLLIWKLDIIPFNKYFLVIHKVSQLLKPNEQPQK